MVTNLCQRATSSIRNFDLGQKAILAGATGLSLFLGGIPTALITFTTLGGTFAFLNRKNTPQVKTFIQEPPPPPKTLPPIDDVKEAEHSWARSAPFPLDASTQLLAPAGPPCSIVWKSNSCFLSSAMWSFFLNEPALLRELPISISKRLAINDLFAAPIETILQSKLTPQKKDALLNIGSRLADKNTPLTKRDLWDLMQNLRILEQGGFPHGMELAAVNPLLSVLELYLLINHCQTNDSVDGDAINELRGMVRRVNGGFKDFGKGYGDASEVILTLADLVFEGSRVEQKQFRTRMCVGNGYTLSSRPKEREVRDPKTGIISGPAGKRDPGTGAIQSAVSNWGHFEIAVKPKRSVNQLLVDHLKETYEASYETESFGVCPFTVHETNQLERPPELLMLTIKRYEDPLVKVQAEKILELGGNLFVNRQKGRYELCGVSRHMGTFAHYEAQVKRPNGSWYHCDDLQGQRGPSKPADLNETAERGYVLFYRKIP